MADFEGFSKRKIIESFGKAAFLDNFAKLKRAIGRTGAPVKPLTEKKGELNQITNQLALKIVKDKKNKNKKKFITDSDKRMLKTVIKDKERLDQAERDLIDSGVGKNINN
tara:strand:+ start:206 stop:535 length:330 start_codon:yes stop_codon:yes gene_type:complete